LLVTRNSIFSDWVRYEVNITKNEEEINSLTKLIPIIIGDVKIPEEIKLKKYLKLNEFDEHDLESVFDTLFHDYYVLKIFLNNNFELDLEKTKESIITFYRLRKNKRIIVRVYNNRFTERLTKELKKCINNDKFLNCDDKRELEIKIDSIELDLYNFGLHYL
jgi:hypothetical protein